VSQLIAITCSSRFQEYGEKQCFNIKCCYESLMKTRFAGSREHKSLSHTHIVVWKAKWKKACLEIYTKTVLKQECLWKDHRILVTVCNVFSHKQTESSDKFTSVSSVILQHPTAFPAPGTSTACLYCVGTNALLLKNNFDININRIWDTHAEKNFKSVN
jgi:hypothetical protein